MQRYSNREFPAYRYTPGLNLHPTISVDGHSYGHQDPDFSPKSVEAAAYLAYGVDLLNHHYFWECHEVCEFLWKQWPRKSREASILQSVILLAVAQLHARRAKPSVAMKVANKGLEKLNNYSGHYQGMYIDEIARYLHTLANTGMLLPEINVSIHRQPK